MFFLWKWHLSRGRRSDIRALLCFSKLAAGVSEDFLTGSISSFTQLPPPITVSYMLMWIMRFLLILFQHGCLVITIAPPLCPLFKTVRRAMYGIYDTYLWGGWYFTCRHSDASQFFFLLCQQFASFYLPIFFFFTEDLSKEELFNVALTSVWKDKTPAVLVFCFFFVFFLR